MAFSAWLPRALAHRWTLEEVWPAVRARLGDEVELHVYGAGFSDQRLSVSNGLAPGRVHLPYYMYVNTINAVIGANVVCLTTLEMKFDNEVSTAFSLKSYQIAPQALNSRRNAAQGVRVLGFAPSLAVLAECVRARTEGPSHASWAIHTLL